jgi:hypothetical protein
LTQLWISKVILVIIFHVRKYYGSHDRIRIGTIKKRRLPYCRDDRANDAAGDVFIWYTFFDLTWTLDFPPPHPLLSCPNLGCIGAAGIQRTSRIGWGVRNQHHQHCVDINRRCTFFASLYRYGV